VLYDCLLCNLLIHDIFHDFLCRGAVFFVRSDRFKPLSPSYIPFSSITCNTIDSALVGSFVVVSSFINSFKSECVIFKNSKRCLRGISDSGSILILFAAFIAREAEKGRV
jgi:hypothetical protein